MKTVFLVIILTLIGFGLAYVKNNPESVNTFFGATATTTPSPASAQSLPSPTGTPGTSVPKTSPQPTLTVTMTPTLTPSPTSLPQQHSVRVRGGEDE